MEANEPLEMDDPDIQDLISRWAGESKRLLVALPGVLAKLEDLQEDTGRLRDRLADLERENVALRQSREELAETFAKLKALISGTTVTGVVADVEPLRSRVAPPPAPSAEPIRRESVSDGHTSEVAHQRETSVQRETPVPRETPAAVPAPNPAAPEGHSPAKPEPSPRAKSEDPVPPPTSVRFSSVFRPPTKS
jgi:hypothetical protein